MKAEALPERLNSSMAWRRWWGLMLRDLRILLPLLALACMRSVIPLPCQRGLRSPPGGGAWPSVSASEEESICGMMTVSGYL